MSTELESDNRREDLRLRHAGSQMEKFINALWKDPADPLRAVGKIEPSRYGIHRVNVHPLVIFLDYYFSPLSLEDLGRKYGCTRQNVQRIIEGTIGALWRSSSPELQSQFPLEELKTGKLKVSKDSYRIAELLESGLSFDQVARTLGVPLPKVWESHKRLERLGVLSRDQQHTARERIVENIRLLEEAEDKGEVERLIGQLAGCTDVPVIRLRSVTEGFYYAPSEAKRFVNVLRSAGVAVGEVELRRGGKVVGRYYYVRTRDLSQARIALAESSDLERFRRNPVVQICGPSGDRIPSSYELLHHDGVKYVSPAKLLLEMGVSVFGNSRRFSLAVFLEDCPVTVYLIATIRHYFVPKEMEAELRAYFAKRIAELRTGKGK